MRRITAVLQLLFLFLERLAVANFELVRDLLRPKLPFQTSIFEYSTKDLDPNEIFLLLSLISLTPGTLTIDRIGNALYVHSLYGNKEDALRKQINRFADLIRKMRPMGKRKI